MQVGIVFVSSLLSCGLNFASTSITLSQIIAESFIILAKYFPFPQLQAAGFQT